MFQQIARSQDQRAWGLTKINESVKSANLAVQKFTLNRDIPRYGYAHCWIAQCKKAMHRGMHGLFKPDWGEKTIVWLIYLLSKLFNESADLAETVGIDRVVDVLALTRCRNHIGAAENREVL